MQTEDVISCDWVGSRTSFVARLQDRIDDLYERCVSADTNSLNARVTLRKIEELEALVEDLREQVRVALNNAI